MENEKISVVVPAYNIVDEIEQCISSLRKQTYENLEVIIVDDGSTDGTSMLIDKLALSDSRIKVIHKPNGGVTRARLDGVKNATGEWIGFVDGDDYVEPSMYKHLWSNAKKYKADISHCGYQMVFPSRVDYYYNTGCLVEQDKITGLKDLLSGSFIEPGLCNKLFHKTLFHSLLHDGKMDCSIKNTEDLLMNYYLFSGAKKAVYEDFCPYHYIVRRNSASNSELNSHRLSDPIRVTDILLKETESEPILHEIVQQKFVRQLICLSTMDNQKNKALILPIKKESLKRLRKSLINVMSKKHYGIKLKFMTLWVCFLPDSYGWVHRIYQKLTGLDKIYEIS